MGSHFPLATYDNKKQEYLKGVPINHLSRLHDNTKAYLFQFYQILDTMIQKMTEADLSDSISHYFIVQMIPHHKAAIKMSYNILNRQLDGVRKVLSALSILFLLRKYHLNALQIIFGTGVVGTLIYSVL